VWHGQEKLEFRDATDAVTQRNYPQGQYVGTTAYFYTRDHLGSIREMFTGGGTVVARYDYDPYGRSTTVLGTTPTDFNFTGLYRHSKSNLDLATYRAYDPDLGRWLSRDQLEDAEIAEGTNLYQYVRDNPINGVDLLGLATKTFIKTDGVTDWSGFWSHTWGHFQTKDFKASGNQAVQVVYHNVCSDPVYKYLKTAKSSRSEWTAYPDIPNNSAHIDVLTRNAWGFAMMNWLVTGSPADPAQMVSLIAECSDGCSM
jgi:RHS repeat-associated protein